MGQAPASPTLHLLSAAYSARSDSTSSKIAVTCSSPTCWSMLMQQTPVSQGLPDSWTSRRTVWRIFVGRLLDDLHRAVAEVEERVGQVLAEHGHVAAPAHVEEIQVRQPGEGRGVAVRVVAAVVDAERPVRAAPRGVERHQEPLVVGRRDHHVRAFAVQEAPAGRCAARCG